MSDHVAIPLSIEFNPAALEIVRADAVSDLPVVQAFVIRTQAEADFAAAQLKDFLRAADEVEAKRKRATDPINASLKEIRSWFKPAEDALTACASALRGALQVWNVEQARKQREQYQLAQAAAKAGDMQAVTEALVASSAAAPVKQEGIATWEVWVAYVRHPTEVPREWCEPDIKRIEAHARAAKGEAPPAPIAGVVFTREVRSRVSR